MSGVYNSVGGFIGTSSGPTTPVQNQNDFLTGLGNYLNGGNNGMDAATSAVQNNGVLGQLFGKGGALQGAVGQLNNLQNQGFQLTQGDHTLYGQASDQIARNAGQAGNAVSNNLAMRGLGSAPSGAAGAMFSGVQGTQNEQLASAQQQIMQQRFQNTLQQIGQQQNFINAMGGQAQNAINQQRMGTIQGYTQGAGQQTAANQEFNQSNLNAANFAQQNKPANFMDYANAGIGSSIYNIGGAPGKAASGAAGSGGSMGGAMASLFA